MATIFTANGSGRGQELWISYGTASSTFLLKDVRPGATGSAPLLLGYLAVNGVADPTRVIFSANDGSNGDELWVTDGTAAGTVLFKDLNGGSGGSFASGWVAVGPRAVFSATDATNGNELWVSTGTAAGTALLANLNAGAADANPTFLGYLMTAGVADTSKAMFVLADGSTGREVWVTDGTPAGTAQLKDINPGAGSSTPTVWTAVNGHAVFTANDGTNGQELWVSDGTAATTSLLLDAAGDLAGSDPEVLGYLLVNGVADPNKLLVALDDITHGRELWVTDGTPGGTALFKDIDSGSAGSDPGAWTALGTHAVFTATTAAAGTELWVSDGTAGGTTLLKDANPGASSSAPVILGNLLVGGVADANTLLVLLDDGTNGAELWTTDGTPGGTVLFKDLNPGANGSFAVNWTSVNGRAVFTADDGSNGTELWVSDGTSGGTSILVDAHPGSDGSFPSLVGYLAVNGVTDTGHLLFLMDDGLTGQELWITDGTPGGTSLFKDVNAGAAGSFATSGLELSAPAVDLSAAPTGVALALGAGTANNVTGSAFGDTLDGNENANTMTGGDGDDTLRGLGGDDVFTGGPGNDTLDGGAGSNTVVFPGIRGASELRFEVPAPGVFNVVVVGPDGIDTTTNVQNLQFSDRTTQVLGAGGVQHLVSVSFPGTGTNRFMIGDAYTGPVLELTDEFVFPTPENINIASTLPNAFIRTGVGDDAITVFSGRNVVDAFTGSNFMTAGTGHDTFFLDARGGGVTWDTIVGFGIGDEVTLWGYVDGVSTDGFDKNSWYASDGVDPFKGLTVHAKLNGTDISASITFAGLTTADEDKLAVTTGTVGGSDYLYITRLS
jgi:ELWxxDGT repeat protein